MGSHRVAVVEPMREMVTPHGDISQDLTLRTEEGDADPPPTDR
jgi:hypothetical protein